MNLEITGKGHAKNGEIRYFILQPLKIPSVSFTWESLCHKNQTSQRDYVNINRISDLKQE